MDRSIRYLLQCREQEFGDRPLFTLLRDGSVAESYSAAYLHQRARAIAARLLQCGERQGPVLIIHNSGIDALTALLGAIYAGCPAIPAPPPDGHQNGKALLRLRGILREQRLTAVLGDTTSLALIGPAQESLPFAPLVPVINSLEVPPELADSYVEPPLSSSDIAYLQYTSGSTSSPKGTVITHRNVLHNCAAMQQAFEYDASAIACNWLPYFHDFGLVHGLILPLFLGIPSYQLSPMSFIKAPRRWLDAITRFGVTHTGAPTFAYELCQRRIKAASLDGLDLSSLRVGVVGAEMVLPEVLERFTSTFGRCGLSPGVLRPGYGLAESTLAVTICDAAAARRPALVVDSVVLSTEKRAVLGEAGGTRRTRRLLSCGAPLPGLTVAVVDPVTLARCAEREVGEIWVAGDSVAQGYADRPAETARTFAVHIADAPGQPFLRTGDLGFLHQGELVFTGRIKDVIIVDGANHSPEDIEHTTSSSHPLLEGSPGAAFAITDEGPDRLVVVREVRSNRQPDDYAQVTESIRAAVFGTHGLSLYAIALVPSGAIPRTSSGKRQRQRCAEQYRSGELTLLHHWQQSRRATGPSASVDAVAVPAVASRSELANLLCQLVAELLELPADRFDRHTPLSSYGMTSRSAVALAAELELRLGRPINATLAFEFPTLEALVEHLAPGPHQPARPETRDPGQHPDLAEPIAVIGLACRVPGADSATALWTELCAGRDAITAPPPDRWKDFAPLTARPDFPQYGGFLSQIDQFDADFFQISPREAERMDPQQRLLLEVAWQALEDAGIVAAELKGQPAGVFIGISTNEYAHLQLSHPDTIDAYLGTGTALSVAPNRISYSLDLCGPSVAVDSACSSSLLAVHLACQSLRQGESTVALAGGVGLLLSPLYHQNFIKAGLLARDGRCKTFDAQADGYVRSEGLGVVVLKPLRRAMLDGDRVYAVIRGSATVHNGASNGIMAPSRHSQEALLRAAYAASGIPPATVEYVEAHGTGTQLGDAMEAQALGAVLGAHRDTQYPLLIGSLKTNIGHLEAAAGVAGLIKVCLSLWHKQLPPSLHFRTPNPAIAFESLGLRVHTTLQKWDDRPGQLRTAGVSSFGFGGSNVHVVLQAAPPLEAAAATEDSYTGPMVLPLSARSEAALRATAEQYLGRLSTGDTLAAARLCTGAARYREHHHAARLAVCADTAPELAAKLAEFVAGRAVPGLHPGHGRPGSRPLVVFCFSGQGGQWNGMAEHLLRTQSAFRVAVEEASHAMAPFLGLSITEQLASRMALDQRSELAVLQPALCAYQLGLAALWRHLGIVPDAVIGHSMGEVAAACVAGALSVADAARVICTRSRLLMRHRGQGRMAMTELSYAQAQALLHGQDSRVCIAASNGPRQTVLSGDEAALGRILHLLAERQIFYKLVQVDVASHSDQVDSLLPDLLVELRSLQPTAPRLPMFSTTTGAWVDGPLLDGRYWARNLREPVLFCSATEHLLQHGFTQFIELSPHPLLTSAVTEIAHQMGVPALAVASARRDEPAHQELCESMARLYAADQSPRWRNLFTARAFPVELPSYPFQRQSFWLPVAAPLPAAAPLPVAAAGRRAPIALDLPAPTWLFQEPFSDHARAAWSEHLVDGVATAPATFALLFAESAAQTLGKGAPGPLEQVEFKQPLVPASPCVQLLFTQPAGARMQWLLTGSPACTYVRGHLGPRAGSSSLTPAAASLGELQSRYGHKVSGSELYDRLRARGLSYGPRFQLVATAYVGADAVLARLSPAVATLPARWAAVTEQSAPEHALIEAAIRLDACLHPAELLLERAGAAAASCYIPTAIGTVQRFADCSAAVWSHCVLRSVDAQGSLRLDVTVLDETGQPLATLCDFELSPLRRMPAAAKLPGMLLRPAFRLSPPARRPVPGAAPSVGQWLLLSDGGQLAQYLSSALASLGQPVTEVVAGPRFAAHGPRSYAVCPTNATDFLQLIQRTVARSDVAFQGIIYLFSLADPTDQGSDVSGEAILQAQDTGCVGLLHLCQALLGAGLRQPPQLTFVTRAVQAVGAADPVRPAQSALLGLARVIQCEHPELACTQLDLEAHRPVAEEGPLVLQELQNPRPDRELALRGRDWYVTRLAVVDTDPLAHRVGFRADARTDAVRLEIRLPGSINDCGFHAAPRRPLKGDEVEIKVTAAALNFSDVLKALGLYPGSGAALLGAECAGEVTAVGDAVRSLVRGQKVVAIAVGAIGSSVITREPLVVPLPESLGMIEAAAQPIVQLTAHYALVEIGRLRPGEQVLIHSAAGGVGIAAIQLAQKLGAEVLATTGSVAKQKFLHRLGVRHVFDSRGTSWPAEVAALTGEAGVDVVVNTLAGDARESGLKLLRPGGRFIELGKRDLYSDFRMALSALQRSLTFATLDLDLLCRTRPVEVGGHLRAIMARLATRKVPLVPHHEFPLGEAVQALHVLARSEHTGKLVLCVNADPVPLSPGTPLTLRADGIYLITGGLGGLGLAMAQLLCERGARHLCLVGRRAPGADSENALAALRHSGAEVQHRQVDVADGPAVARLVTELTKVAPLRGIIHAAGLLADATLPRLRREQLEQVMRPKIAGAWNLHNATRDRNLDFFVMFSSAAALLGSPGQGGYAAANAFLDGLAYHRRALHLPALSINFGPFVEVGLAASAERGGRLAHGGVSGFTPAEGQLIVEQLLGTDVSQLGVLRLDLRRYLQTYPRTAAASLYAELVAADALPAATVAAAPEKAALLALPAGPRRYARLLEFVTQQLAMVLRCDKRPAATSDFKSLGVDSLLAIELRNRLEHGLGVRLLASLIFTYPTVSALCFYLDAELQSVAPIVIDASISAAGPPRFNMAAEPAARQDRRDDIEIMSDADALAALQRDPTTTREG